jgi:site-specific DNA-methyltransferase (adenine-specific)
MNPVSIKFLLGDNLAHLQTMADNSVDSVVTDCPYGFGKEPDATKVLAAWVESGYYQVKGSGFMGKAWDAFVPQPLFWKEVFRVLKPGGYVLAFFGTRTYDWGTMAIRLSGFEIRDQMQWIYGSGYPKSLNVSKAIDKAAGAEREIVSTGKSVKRMIPGGDQDKTGSWIKDNGKVFIPTETISATDEAKEWEGWGTALKPANEPICMARKPLEGTVSENILKWGTGAINIDACRIEFTGDKDIASATWGRGTDILGGNYVGSKHSSGKTNIEANSAGRFPSNVILDGSDEVTGLFPETESGEPGTMRKGTNDGAAYGAESRPAGTLMTGFGDKGSAARFFYCAKASTSERGEGNDHPTVKPVALMRYLVRLVTPAGGTCLDPFNGSGTTGLACKCENRSYVGIDDDAHSIEISKNRIKTYHPDPEIHSFKQGEGKNQMDMFEQE